MDPRSLHSPIFLLTTCHDGNLTSVSFDIRDPGASTMALPCMGHQKVAMPRRGHAFRWQPAPWVASAFDWCIHLVHSPGAIWCNLVQSGCIMGALWVHYGCIRESTVVRRPVQSRVQSDTPPRLAEFSVEKSVENPLRAGFLKSPITAQQGHG